MGKGMRYAFPLRALALAALVAVPSGLQAAPASFNYGGHLNFNGNPVTGAAELQFRLFSAPTGGILVNPNPPVVPTTLNNGDFNASVDLSALGGLASIQDDSHSIQDNWLEVSVRRPGEQNFTPLSPRQQFSPIPGALYAEETAHAGLADRVAAAGIGHAQLAPGAVQADSLLSGTVVRSLNGMTDDVHLQGGNGVTLQSANGTITISATGGGTGDGWSLTGNAGTTDGQFLGTTDFHPLILKAGGIDGLRLEQSGTDPGYGVNLLVNKDGGNTIAQGVLASSVLGGRQNVMAGIESAVIGGGENNVITNADLNFYHYDRGLAAVIPGGINNFASGNYSFAAGSQAEAIHQGAFVWGDTSFDGNGGHYPDTGPFPSIRENEFAVRARGGVRFVTGGTGLMLDGPITGKGVSLPAGSVTPPQLAAPNAAPGRFLTLDADGAFVWSDAPAGGSGNGWLLGGNAGTTGDQFLGTTDQRPLILKVGGLQAVRFEIGQSSDNGNNPPNIVGGLANNSAGAGTYGSFIGTGSYLTNGSYFSFIGAGSSLEIGTNSQYSVLVGGFDNFLGDNSSGALIGGGENNRIADSVGAVLTGGIENLITNSPGSSIGGGEANRILPTDAGNPTSVAVIAGGGQNQIIGSSYAAIGGGANNVIGLGGGIGTIAGGQQNKIVNGGWRTIGGGINNQVNVSAGGGTIGGGANNSIGLGSGFYNAGYATVPGGYGNTAAGEFSFAAGLYAQATNTGAFVWSDGMANQFDQFFSITENEFAVRARGGIRFDTGGKGLVVDGIVFNPGGNGFALGNGAVTAAKLSAPNPQPGQFLSVDGNGSLLWAPAPGGGGGPAWLLGGNGGTIDGQFLGTTDNRPLELRAGNQPGLRLAAAANASGETGVNVVGGYGGNSVATGATGATIGGGGKQDADGTAHPNRILGSYATVAGGFDNFGGDVGTVVGGGSRNRTTDTYATVAGGLQNSALGNSSTVGGGFNNQAGSANGLFATTGGGANNIASGEFATVPGGSLNQATGLSTFAAGHRALATNDGAFVWADSTEADFGSLLANEFAVRARNGVRFDTGGSGLTLDGTSIGGLLGGLVVANQNTDQQVVHAGITGTDNGPTGNGVIGSSAHGTGVSATSGDGYALHAYSDTGTGLFSVSAGAGGSAIQAQVVSGGTLIQGYRYDPNFGVVHIFDVASDGTVTGKAFNTTSDRHAKEGFAAINPREVLDKVAALPISQWQFKGDDKVSHLGPMAQDFHAAFGLGQDDKHIATVDEEGVALAAIQGLHQVMQEKDAEIHDLKQSVAGLKAMVEQLAQRQNK